MLGDSVTIVVAQKRLMTVRRLAKITEPEDVFDVWIECRRSGCHDKTGLVNS